MNQLKQRQINKPAEPLATRIASDPLVEAAASGLIGRRGCLINIGSAALLLGAGGLVGVAALTERKPKYFITGGALAEFSDLYIKKYLPLQADRRKVTVLYPGSGSDLSPLEIGFQVLHRTNVEEVNFVFTEVSPDVLKINWRDGGSEVPGGGYHENLSELAAQLDEKVKDLAQRRLVKIKKSETRKENKWQQKTAPGARVITYEMEVLAGNKAKKMTLTLCYNVFENRKEPTETERKRFPGELIKTADANAWARNPLKGKSRPIYPTYFLQGQFDECDILLSKMSGNFNLLQFDYIRALANTKVKKQRVILSEHPGRLEKVKASIPGHDAKVEVLKENRYGYCSLSPDTCKAGVLITRAR